MHGIQSKHSSGFTLIELMIVVAIIGILAAIAIPSYSNYIARSQTSEAIVLLGALKIPIESEFSQSSTLPQITALTSRGYRINGKYTRGITLENNNQYTAELKGLSTVNSNIANKTVALIYNTTNGQWICSTGVSNGISDKYLPASCK